MLLFMRMFLNVLSGMANSVDPDQTRLLLHEQSDLGLHCICHFVRNFGVRNFRTFTVRHNCPKYWDPVTSTSDLVHLTTMFNLYHTLGYNSEDTKLMLYF